MKNMILILTVVLVASCDQASRRFEVAKDAFSDCTLVYRNNYSDINVDETFIFYCDSNYVVVECNKNGIKSVQTLP